MCAWWKWRGEVAGLLCAWRGLRGLFLWVCGCLLTDVRDVYEGAGGMAFCTSSAREIALLARVSPCQWLVAWALSGMFAASPWDGRDRKGRA